MKKKTKGILSAALTAVLAILTSALPANGDAYFPSNRFAGNWADQVGLNIVETYAYTGQSLSYLTALKNLNSSSGPDEYICKSVGASPCDFDSKSTSVRANIIAPRCTGTSQTNCIEDVQISNESSAPGNTVFTRQLAGSEFEAVPKYNITKGARTSIWSSTVQHAGNTGEYAVYVAFELSYDRANKKFYPSSFSAEVLPTKTRLDSKFTPAEQFERVSSGRNTVTQMAQLDSCVWYSSGSCGVLQDFSPGTKVSLSIRMEKTIAGWFKGRMQNPELSINSLDAKTNLVKISSEPVSVARSTVTASKNTPDRSVKKFINSKDYPFLKFPGTHNSRADYPNAMAAIDAFRDIMADTASGVNTIWSAGTTPQGFGGGKCLTDKSKVLGIVTTNSTTYEGSAPSFSKGFLEYKVGGMHFLPDGVTPVIGTYDLAIRSDVARCLYGFSKAPLSATVSVVNDKGTKTTATTVVSEKNNWLKLAAYNFTFSKKTIKVKITKKR